VEARAEEYASAWTSPPSSAVRAVLNETQAKMAHPQMARGIKEARLIQALIFANGARIVLELGTFTGATALAIAEALPPGGCLTTIEVSDEIADIAESHFARSEHASKIDLRRGDAREIVKSLEGPFDLVFIDAWKQHYIQYYEALVPKLSERGLIVADNVIWYGLPFHPDAHGPDRGRAALRAPRAGGPSDPQCRPHRRRWAAPDLARHPGQLTRYPFATIPSIISSLRPTMPGGIVTRCTAGSPISVR
jgi:caffeoyl-CoA O-methyltransferase